MAEATPPIDSPELLTWEDARTHGDWTGLLVGNGASIAFWEDFKYDSLYERSLGVLTNYALTAEDVALFDALRTKNFERVLASLKTAGIVGTALSRKTDFLRTRYESVQRALFEAVHSVHVPWGTTLNFDPSLTQIRDELATYRWVYSVNYDLLIYWAIMTQPRARGFVDFFWHGDLTFRPDSTEPPGDRRDDTRILYLHGGIHLRRHVGGSTFKARATEQDLLSQFSTSYVGDATPLLVSEGDADDKFRAILRSDYLEFGYRSLAGHEGDIAIFGCSLRSEDSHLRRAVNEQPISKVAISLRRSDDPAEIVERKAERLQQFPRSDLVFYDAETHPLGAPSIRVKRTRFGVLRRLRT